MARRGTPGGGAEGVFAAWVAEGNRVRGPLRNNALVGKCGLEQDLDPEPIGVEAVKGAASVPVVTGLCREGHAALPELRGEAVHLFAAVHDESEVVQGTGRATKASVEREIVRS